MLAGQGADGRWRTFFGGSPVSTSTFMRRRRKGFRMAWRECTMRDERSDEMDVCIVGKLNL